MKMLNYKENAPLIALFTAEESCLVSFLNALIPMDCPLVSANIFQKDNPQALSVVRRENSAIFVINCRNEKGETMEISLIMGMDHSMLPHLLRAFMGMVGGNETENLEGEEKTYYASIMLAEKGNPQEKGHKSHFIYQKNKDERPSPFYSQQKFVFYAMDQYKFRDPKLMEELWLCFLREPHSPLLEKHPMLPENLVKARAFLEEYEKNQ